MNRRKAILMLLAGLIAFSAGFLSTVSETTPPQPLVSAAAAHNIAQAYRISPQ